MKEYTRQNSLRLQGYDYSRPGYYFITVCTKDGEVFFGEIRDGRMYLNEYGHTAEAELRKTAEMTNIALDCFTVMPNHVHFVAVITPNAGGKNAAPTEERVPHARQKIPVMVQNYKAAVSRTLGFSPWHRSFFDRIIKTQERLDYIRTYIRSNPTNWETDHLHPWNFEEYIRKHPL